MQHDHILIRMDLDKFCAHVDDYCDGSSALFDFIGQVKARAQVTKCTLLIQGFKQLVK